MKNIFLLIMLFSCFLVKSQQSDSKSDKIFREWDLNSDNKLSLKEYLSSFYSYFDLDRNKEVDSAEWQNGSKYLSSADTVGFVPGTTEPLEIKYGSAVDSLEETTVTGSTKAMTRRDFYKKMTVVFSEWDENNNNFIEPQEFDNHWAD